MTRSTNLPYLFDPASYNRQCAAIHHSAKIMHLFWVLNLYPQIPHRLGTSLTNSVAGFYNHVRAYASAYNHQTSLYTGTIVRNNEKPIRSYSYKSRVNNNSNELANRKRLRLTKELIYHLLRMLKMLCPTWHPLPRSPGSQWDWDTSIKLLLIKLALAYGH